MTDLLLEFRNKIITGDALSVCRKIPSDSIDCVVTSGPYYGLRSYGTSPVVWPPTQRQTDGTDIETFKDLYETCQHEFKTQVKRQHAGRGDHVDINGETSEDRRQRRSNE